MTTNQYAKKPVEQLKNKRIYVQFTEAEFDLISERSKLFGMSKAALVRFLIGPTLDKRHTPLFDSNDRAALLDSMTLAAETRVDLISLTTILRNDSTNLNQIAKLLNARQNVDLNELIGVLSNLANQVSEIKDLVNEFNAVEPEVLKRILKGE